MTARLLHHGADLLSEMGELPPVHVYTTTRPVDGCQLHIRGNSRLSYLDQQKILDAALSTLFHGHTEVELARHNAFRRQATITNNGVITRVFAENDPPCATAALGFEYATTTSESIALIREVASLLTSLDLTGAVAANVQDTGIPGRGTHADLRLWGPDFDTDFATLEQALPAMAYTRPDPLAGVHPRIVDCLLGSGHRLLVIGVLDRPDEVRR